MSERPRLKIGVLGAVVGTLDNGGRYFVQPIANAGQRVPAMNNDAPGLIPDAITLGNNGDFLYRVVRDGSERYAVPNYNLAPEEASNRHTDLIWPLIDDYVKENLDKIWIATVNELDQDRADWIGEFCFWQAQHFEERGAKVSLPGWAAGTPYETAWYEEGMQLYLSYCAEHPDKAAVCLHEYSYTTETIWGTWLPYPFGLGRFQFLFMACDDMGIARPKVHIGEFGWVYDDVPGRSKALSDIHQAGSLYGLFPEIQAAGVWYSGKFGGGIDKKVNSWFQDWGQLGANWEPLPIESWHDGNVELLVNPVAYGEKQLVFIPAEVYGGNEPRMVAWTWYGEWEQDKIKWMPEPEPEETLEEHIWKESLVAQTVFLGDTALEKFVASKPGYHIVGTEGWTKAEPDNDEPPPPPPPGTTYDLAEYIFGDGRQYEVKHANDSQETFQTQREGNTVYQVKNQQWEQFWHGNDHIWRGKDISPGPAPDYAERPGESRWYWQYNVNPQETMARWCPRRMKVGETWISEYEHEVQFYYKKDCAKSSANSGGGLRNSALLVAHYDTFVTDQGGVVNNVLLLEANGEKFYFGKNWGLIQWGHPESESGTKASSFTGELHSGRPDLVRETGCFS